MPYAVLAKSGKQFISGYISLYFMEMWHPLSFSELALIYGMYIDANIGCSYTSDDNVLLYAILAGAVLEKCANYKCHLNKIQP